MSYYDTDILIQNINKLMKDNNITQVKLAQILGMSQSNVSKALSHSDKKSFTLDQIVGISKHFGLSIDFLVGNEQPKKTELSPRSIAAFIAKIIENGDAQIQDIERSEYVFDVKFGNNPPYSCESKQEERTITYPAIYLSDYWQIPADASFEEEQELYAEASQVGNESRMLPVNDFIRKFISIHDIYKKGGIDEDAYRLVIENYLSRLRDR